MRTLLPLIMAALGLGVGFGTRSLIDSSEPHATPLPLFRSPKTSPSPIDAEPAAPERQDAPASPLDRLLAEIPPPAAPPVAGAITGVVRTASGAPFPDLEIELRSVGVAPGSLAIDIVANDLEEYVRRRVDQHRYIASTRRFTTTRADGTFAFEGLPRGEYGLGITVSGMKFDRTCRGRAVQVVEPGDRVTIVAQGKPTSLVVDVKYASGRRPDSAAIIVDGVEQATPWTPNQRNVAITPGPRRLHATVGNASTEDLQILVGAGEDPEPVSLIIENENEIAIRLTQDGPEPSVNTHVFWVECEPGEAQDPERLVGYGARVERSARTPGAIPGDESSGYLTLIAGLVPGTYWVGAGYQADTVVTMVEVDVPELGSARAALHLPPPEPGGVLTLSVYDGDGAPVGYANVTLIRGRGERAISLDERPIRQTGGVAAFALHRGLRELMDRGDLRVRVSWESAERIVLVDRTDLRVDFAPMCEARIELVAEGDTEGLRVVLVQEDSGKKTFVSDLRGLVDLDLLDEPGGRRVTVEAGIYDIVVSGATELHRERVELLPGEQTVTVRLASVITLEVVGEEEGFFVQMTKHGDTVQNFRATGMQDDGVVTFAGLTPGMYTLIGAGGFMEIDVQRSARIRFEPVSPNAFRVNSVRASDELVALLEGDLILGAGGRRFDGFEEARRVFVGLNTESASVDILRDGVEMTVEVPASFWAYADLTPTRR